MLMPRVRWIVPWADSETKPAIYHCIARVVDKRFAFGPEDKEQFRMYLRMMENFSGCRVLAYCVMCNHFHLLLEVTPRPKSPWPSPAAPLRAVCSPCMPQTLWGRWLQPRGCHARRAGSVRTACWWGTAP